MNDIVHEITERRSQMGDEIIARMLKEQHLPFDPQKIREAGYEIVINTDNNVTTYKLCNVIDMHTVTTTLENSTIKIEVDKR